MASSKRDVHVVFLGPTGSGKSRLCNYLLEDDKAFKVEASFRSVTQGIQSKWKSVNYKDQLIAMKFIDTQGLADTRMSNAQVISIVKDAIKQDVTYVNYFVIILKPGRMTDENRNALEDIIKAFKLDDNERKQHVYVLLSHCECASNELMQKYIDECQADRTIKRLIVSKNNVPKNVNCLGLPQPHEVNEWMHEGIMKWMVVQRRQLMDYLCQPIEDIQPVKEGIFENLCTIL